MTVYYLDGRHIHKKDLPKDAIFIRREKTYSRWAGKNHRILEKYYRSNKRSLTANNNTPFVKVQVNVTCK